MNRYETKSRRIDGVEFKGKMAYTNSKLLEKQDEHRTRNTKDCRNKQTNEGTNERTNGRTNERTNRRAGGRVDMQIKQILSIKHELFKCLYQ